MAPAPPGPSLGSRPEVQGSDVRGQRRGFWCRCRLRRTLQSIVRRAAAAEAVFGWPRAEAIGPARLHMVGVNVRRWAGALMCSGSNG